MPCTIQESRPRAHLPALVRCKLVAGLRKWMVRAHLLPVAVKAATASARGATPFLFTDALAWRARRHPTAFPGARQAARPARASSSQQAGRARA